VLIRMLDSPSTDLCWDVPRVFSVERGGVSEEGREPKNSKRPRQNAGQQKLIKGFSATDIREKKLSESFEDVFWALFSEGRFSEVLASICIGQ